MRASELYAISQGSKCDGREKCYWCLGPCTQHWKHDDVPYLPFSKSSQLPKYPGGHYICSGCWHWRRKSLTVNYLGGGQKDRQQPKDHSWIITKTGAYGITPAPSQHVIDYLTNPDLPFCLSIVTNDKIPNLIHLAEVNQPQELTAETLLEFTVDHTLFTYSIYELEEGLKYGREGKMPGVQALIKMFAVEKGKDEVNPIKEEPRPVGRPKEMNQSDKQKYQNWKHMKRNIR